MKTFILLALGVSILAGCGAPPSSSNPVDDDYHCTLSAHPRNCTFIFSLDEGTSSVSLCTTSTERGTLDLISIDYHGENCILNSADFDFERVRSVPKENLDVVELHSLFAELRSHCLPKEAE